ncbi:MAG: lipase family protein [Candidatus Hydrogenedentes bacterium]|nr:lipase family protein [Candidatus Hydrogenedentota bacterium]
MEYLTPDITSVLARDVYDLRLDDDLSALGASVPQWLGEFNPPQRMTGTSGAFLRSRSGFGFFSSGRGKRAREALVVMRGTATLADGLTDLSCGVQLGPRGFLVHSGFNETFDSLREQLNACFGAPENRGVSHVHCVGHSLGGALATLVADYARARGLRASLYTFGSPRVGYAAFSSQLTDALGPDDIFRVYHANDPVSMVPLFPFLHAPDRGQVVMLPAKYHAYDFSAHSMNGYVSDVSGRGWREMRCGATNWLERLDSNVRLWLDSGDRSVLSHYGGNILWFLGKALLQLLRVALSVESTGLQVLVSAGFTLVDSIAWLLGRAALLKKEVGTMLERILKALMTALGRSIEGIQDVTVAVLRFSIGLLLGSISNQVTRAIAIAHGASR